MIVVVESGGYVEADVVVGLVCCFLNCLEKLDS